MLLSYDISFGVCLKGDGECREGSRLDPDQSYTFSKIFELKTPADELANEFAYGYSRKK